MVLHKRLLPVGLVALICLYAIVPGGEKVLYETDSAYNHIVVTEDSEGLRSLLFEKDGALQSVVKVGDPDRLELAYVKAMLVGLAFSERPQRVLIVGLGGGTIPQFLHKHYPRLAIDVVEIDPEVVAVAKRFFGLREDEQLAVHVEDGRKFIEKCRLPYDIIFLDAYGCDSIPYHLATRDFLAHVRKALAPGGVGLGNLWSRASNRLYDSMVRTYLDVFDELYIFDVRASGNKILVALPRKVGVRRDELAARARAVGERDGFPYDLGDVVTYGFRNAAEERFDGRILTDTDPPEKAEEGVEGPWEEE